MRLLTKDTLKIFWRHSIHYRWLLFFAVTGLALATAAELYKPLLYKQFFDILASTSYTETAGLMILLGKILAISGAYWILWRIATLAVNDFESRTMRDLTNTCFEYLHDHSYKFFSNNFGGSLVRKVGRYSKSFEDIADQGFFNIGQTILRIGIIGVVIYFLNPLLFLVILGWALAYSILSYFFMRYKMKFDRAKSEKDSEVTGFLADTITNNTNIKLFASKAREFLGFKKTNNELHLMRKKSWNLGIVAEAIQGAFMIILEIAIMYVAIILWRKGQLTIGDFVLLQAYLNQIMERMWNLSRNFQRIYESLADADEMTEILLTPHEIQNTPNAGKLAVPQGTVKFNHVSFGYHDNKNILNNFNLSIEPGEKVAFVGSSGGGKSTIIKLLFRFHDLTKGTITIDKQNITSVTQESLRENISLVPQDPILFHRSLMENIRYAKPGASDEQVIAAAKSAHCHEFISQFPEQYNTLVGERGIKLSGGERQRVAIARAILKNAPILVLDEATSSLDSESEKLIQDALKILMKGKTTIVVAHRLSTIVQMDRIIVISEGKIIEQGDHNHLLKLKNGTYQQLWHIQAGGFA